MKKIKIEKVQLGQFIDLINSIGKVDKFISLRMNEEKMKSSVFFPGKDAVKAISLPIEEFFDFKTPPDRNIKMCFYDGTVVNSILKKFEGPGIISAEITVKESGNEENELYATALTLYNQALKITISCTDPESGFIELTPAQIDAVFDTSNSMFSFTLESSQINKFEDLMNIDKDKSTFSISSKEDGIYLSGTSYDYQVSEKSSGKQETQYLFKKFFTVLDKDDYKVSVLNDKTFFESEQKDVRIVFSNASE